VEKSEMSNQAESLERLLKYQNATKQRAKNIFAFSSGKGGTGKTFLSVNLSYILAKSGFKTLFVDFDSNLSNADVLLNISYDDGIIGFLRGEKQIRNCITKVAENFYGIFGESGMENFPQITSGTVERFTDNLDLLSHDFDFIIIDTGAGINHEIVHLLFNVANIVLVINPEPTTIMDAYAVLKMLSGINNKKSVIVNSTFSIDEGNAAFENISKAAKHFLNMNIEFLGQLNFNKEIRQSIIDQQLFCMNYFGGNSYLQIESISKKLMVLNQLANIQHPAI